MEVEGNGNDNFLNHGMGALADGCGAGEIVLIRWHLSRPAEGRGALGAPCPSSVPLRLAGAVDLAHDVNGRTGGQGRFHSPAGLL